MARAKTPLAQAFNQALRYEERGLSYQNKGEFSKAKEALYRAFTYFKKAKSLYDQINTALSLADVLRQLEKFKEAQKWYTTAQTLVAKHNTQKEKDLLVKAIDAAMGKALCLRGLGNFLDAEGWFKDLVNVYQHEKDREGQAYALWALGTTQRFLGRLSAAKKHLTKSVALYKKLKDPIGLAYAECGLGGTLRMMGDARQSGRLYASAHQVFKREKDDFGLAYSTCGQANAARMLRQNKKSRRLFSQAAKLYRNKKQKGPLGFVLWSLALLALSEGKNREAKTLLRQVEQLFKSVQDKRGMIYSELGWGLYHQAQKSPKSDAYFRRAYKNSKKMALFLEMGHAKRNLTLINPWPYYKSLGVHVPSFQKYPSLP